MLLILQCSVSIVQYVKIITYAELTGIAARRYVGTRYTLR
jgi:hypothetical protein